MPKKEEDLVEKTINEFRLEDVPLSSTWVVIGCPGAGKSALMENFAYYRKHVYPVAKIFVGNEDGYKKSCKIYPPLYVLNYWDEAEENRHIQRQKSCVMENGKEYVGSYAINIIDDMGDDPTVYRSNMMKGLFKIGSQHWAQLCMIGTQYSIDFGTDVRSAVSYVAIGRAPDEEERKKIYKNFGGICGSFNRFCDLMDALTGDHTFVIIKKRSQSNELEECVFYYQTKVLKEWKFGCEEYRKWSSDRYDTSYQEQISSYV
jgi:hypothetical protein